MKIKEVMTPNPITITSDTRVSEAAGILKKHRIGGLPVMSDERIVGIVTETDILSLLDTDELSDDLWLPSPLEIIEIPIRECINWEKTKKALKEIGKEKISEIMSTEVIFVEDDAGVDVAAKLMTSEGIARLPVVRNGKLVGIVTRQDIVRGISLSDES